VSDPGEIEPGVETDCSSGLSGDGGAEHGNGFESSGGTADVGDGAEGRAETEDRYGPVPRDPATSGLLALTQAWEDLQHVRLALDQRGMGWAAEGVKVLEDKVARLVSKALREHPLWPWLSQYPGLGGIHVARIIAIIGDPRRFPGPRSLYHYFGVHVVNGRLPMRHKGQRCDWNPKGRTALLMPGGICEQIVRLRVPKYRDRHDMEKERLQRERGVVELPASEVHRGPALPPSEGVEVLRGIDVLSGPLRPFQIEQRAQIIAGKAFLADLWRAWCELLNEEDVDA